MSRVLVRSALRVANQPHRPTCPSRASLPLVTATAPSNVRCHSHSSSTNSSSSVNASEVSHFTQLASSWWNPHGPSRLLHLMNPLRHDFIQSCLATSDQSVSKEQEKERYTFLDIGCGGGIFASSAARLPSTKAVVAIDPTPEVVAVAERHKRSDPLLAQPGRLSYLNCAIEDLAAQLEPQTQSETQSTSPPNKVHNQGQETRQSHDIPQFDFVTVFEVIEHIDRPSEFLRTCLTHLKPGGWLIGSTIARHQLSYLTTKLIAEAPWPIGVVPQGTHDWNKYINPDELQQWVRKENRSKREDTTSETVEELGPMYGEVKIEGCIYLPLVGWKFVNGSERFGNYFFGMQKLRQ